MSAISKEIQKRIQEVMTEYQDVDHSLSADQIVEAIRSGNLSEVPKFNIFSAIDHLCRGENPVLRKEIDAKNREIRYWFTEPRTESRQRGNKTKSTYHRDVSLYPNRQPRVATTVAQLPPLWEIDLDNGITEYLKDDDK